MKLVVSLLLFASVALADISPFNASIPVPFKDAKYFPLDSRITNGNEARTGQFPYQVGLSLAMQNGGAWCGGTLISNQWVLTAAHCTQGCKSVTVYLGSASRAGGVYVTVSSANIIIHSRYNANAISDDISLIKLPYKIALSQNIQPARLPGNNLNSYAGQQAIASGWGKTSDAGSVTNTLRYVPLGVIANNQCKNTFGSYIKDSNICTDGAYGRSICNGDSGGPLCLTGTNTLVGISSFVSGLGCTSGHPASFTRVAYYLSWILSYTGPL